MADEGDSERLRQLEARIEKAKGTEDGPLTGAEKYSQAQVAWRMVTELVAGLGIGFGIGYGLDALFGTRPFLMVLFILLGFVAGVRVMLRTAQEVQQQASGQSPGDDERD